MATTNEPTTEEVPEAVEGEVILGVQEGGEPGGDSRNIRVYDRNGDFVITIPSEARLTFGYFNPAASERNTGGYQMGPGGQTMRTTCLRIYADNSDKRQLAAFLGVDGFRDLSIGKVTLKQKVTIEHNFEDDGLGNTKLKRDVQRALVQASEEEVPF